MIRSTWILLPALLLACSGQHREESTMTAAEKTAHTNRLIHAASPYLQQHAHNPVDWYEWGPEALEKARQENKPIFLSIGYSACHWCHVMAHESFEDEQTAAVMNRYFVNIKVDREERPDIDDIYMQATLIVNRGQGGWPMSVWMTPDLKPFFAGTYFPPESRFGRPGFRDLCERVGQLWEADRDALTADAERLAGLVRQSLTPQAGGGQQFSLEQLDRVAMLLAEHFDETHGGILSGGTNKFPPSMAMELMLRAATRHGYRTGGESAAAADRPAPAGSPASRPAVDPQRLVSLVERTLDRMARGGIYDHLAGGIARYSTDVRWLVPHFEKMLYDQALVSGAYLSAYQLTGKPEYARVARSIFEYVLADLQSPQGGFYSARDADSEGEEGKFYVWTRAEILAALDKEDGELFCSAYDVSDAGNWDDPHAPGVEKNILHLPRELDVVAKLYGIERPELERRLAACRAKLLDVRSRRVPPHRDEKILAEWNGLMIAALARGGAILDEPRYTDAAARAARFILEKQFKDGRLLRSWRDGRVLEAAFLSDYAAMIEGLLDLYEATFDRAWLDHALRLNDAVIEHYADEQHGGFYFTADDHETLLTRNKDIRDGAVPSGNSVQLMNLLRLATIFDRDDLRKLAERSMQCFASDVLQSPAASERFLAAVEFALAGPVEIAVVGDPAAPATRELLAAVQRTYLPNRVLMLLDPRVPDRSPTSPLLAGREMIDGRPTAYVCREYACKLPVTTAGELSGQLAER